MSTLKSSIWLRVAPLPVLLLLASAASLSASEPKGQSVADPAQMIRRFAADEAALRSYYRQPLSGFRLERMRRFLTESEQRLGTIDYAALDTQGRVDCLLLRNHLQRRRDELALRAQRNVQNLALLPFAPELLELEAARRRLEAVEPRRAASQLAALLQSVSAVRARVERGLEGADKERPADSLQASPVVAYRASQELGGLRRTLKTWFEYRDGFEPSFRWWVRKPFEALDTALASYAGLLAKRVAGVKGKGPAPLIGDPIGREALVAALAREFIPYTPEALIRIAEREFAWCEAQGVAAAKALGLEGGWSAAVEHVKGLHRAPGQQEDLVAEQAREAIAFLEKRELVTIPALCKETWHLEMISEQGQKTLPFAVYNDQKMLVAYATEGMAHEAKLMSMRGNNEHFTRIVTPHELIPGHHLQLFQAQRHRPYRALFRTPFLVEGWALHWEMLLWDLGWARGPADRVGMLFWRMHRCARILVTLRFHLGQLKPEGMVDFLVERVGLERDGARSEVRRYVAGAYGPLYQCAYMLGGLQLRALHKELVGGGKLSERAFHDTVLEQNSIPIELIRVALQGSELALDARSTWRFAGEPAAEGGR